MRVSRYTPRTRSRAEVNPWMGLSTIKSQWRASDQEACLQSSARCAHLCQNASCTSANNHVQQLPRHVVAPTLNLARTRDPFCSISPRRPCRPRVQLSITCADPSRCPCALGSRLAPVGVPAAHALGSHLSLRLAHALASRSSGRRLAHDLGSRLSLTTRLAPRLAPVGAPSCRQVSIALSACRPPRQQASLIQLRFFIRRGGLCRSRSPAAPA